MRSSAQPRRANTPAVVARLCAVAVLLAFTTLAVAAPRARAQAVTVFMAGERFTPGTVTVAAGSTVTWNNNDGASHTVTDRGGAFDSGTMRRGAIFEFTFSAPGTFAYICDFHGGMRGTVNVTAAGGGTPTPPLATPTPPPPTPTPPPPTATPSPPPRAHPPS